MPWSLKQRGSQWCVVKQGETEPVPGGCHSSREKALAHQRALYANEPSARTGSVRGMVAPLKPPRSWFELEEANDLTPLQITADGQVSGHLAPWESCHTGFMNGAMSECVKAPRSPSGYTYFHLGELETAEGDLVAVGKITYGGPHAPITAGLRAASAHYDNTGSVAAFVRASDGRHGIWLSGAMKSNLPEEAMRDVRANSLSGDWRQFGHALELIASLAVPVPGFPIPRSQMALAASGEVSALILTAPAEIPRSRDYLRQRHLISESLDSL